MKIYILADKRGMPYSTNAYAAHHGFEMCGYETVMIQSIDDIKDADPENIVFAGIGNIRKYLKDVLDIDISEVNFDYPEQLQRYLGRKVVRTTLEDVHKEISTGEHEPFFIKPVRDQKMFTGILVEQFKHLPPIFENMELWKSEPVHFVSEFRCYVYYRKLLGVNIYKGSPFKALDEAIVREAVAMFTDSPVSYSLDFGVTDDGRTLLIEANDAHSLGNYGLQTFQYARMISSRWAELTGTTDYLKHEY